MNMDCGANKTPVAVIKEGAFEGTHFRDIYSGINVKWYRKSWKVFVNMSWKILTKNVIVQIIMVLVLMNMVLNMEHLKILGK